VDTRSHIAVMTLAGGSTGVYRSLVRQYPPGDMSHESAVVTSTASASVGVGAFIVCSGSSIR